MSNNTKVVNIYPSFPITTIKPAIYSSVRNVTKSFDEIRECLISKARVEEILEDKTIIKLDLSNYNRNNTKIATIPGEFIQETAVSYETEKDESGNTVVTDLKIESIDLVQPEAVEETNQEDPISNEEVSEEVVDSTPDELSSTSEELVEDNEEINEDDKYGL